MRGGGAQNADQVRRGRMRGEGLRRQIRGSGMKEERGGP